MIKRKKLKKDELSTGQVGMSLKSDVKETEIANDDTSVSPNSPDECDWFESNLSCFIGKFN